MHALQYIAPTCAWVVALAWGRCALQARMGLREVPDLLEDRFLGGTPRGKLTVIVPARNEQGDITDCLESLAAQDCEGLEVIAVDDRSTDRTGSLMDDIALRYPDRLRVIHIDVLPPGWLGKTHAMHTAARVASSDYLLFTDADIKFRADALRRALHYFEVSGADHLVVAPTTIIRRWDEASLLGFFQLMGLWAARPWKVSDPAARDSIGIGAFNMIRRDVYEKIGGFATLRMEVVEDLGLGRRVKRAGFAQRVAFGRGLLTIHWASGANGLVGVMTKNMFAGFRYSILLLVLGCGWLAVFCVLPFPAVFFPVLMAPALATVCCIAACYQLMSPISGLSGWNVLLAPFAGSLFIYTLLRSMAMTIWQGGVRWRGTFYSLAELRRELPPLREVLLSRRDR